eukprot:gb/GEZN01017039.1/.p1 GENE.gb/GEZN01017039.1/~~gb/GEZN01017039.1/.p1  ORF type:complete len:142 (+),score=13.56 gb/GEZN01017039.1/:79-504(+)
MLMLGKRKRHKRATDDVLYCVCRQPWDAQGENENMTECSGSDCPSNNWLHWGCVNLRGNPRGTWYCDNCVAIQQTTTEVAVVSLPSSEAAEPAQVEQDSETAPVSSSETDESAQGIAVVQQTLQIPLYMSSWLAWLKQHQP